MKLVAQRVVQVGSASHPRSGINAFCYLHGDRFWLDSPPDDLGRGKLVGQIIEVAPPVGNRVRSYLDVTAPDSTPDRQIVGAVQSGADFLADAGRPPPWRFAHGEVSFVFELEAALAAQWQVELRMLLGYALAARQASSEADGGAGILSGNIFER
jgi:hypothetical protein